MLRLSWHYVTTTDKIIFVTIANDLESPLFVIWLPLIKIKPMSHFTLVLHCIKFVLKTSKDSPACNWALLASSMILFFLTHDCLFFFSLHYRSRGITGRSPMVEVMFEEEEEVVFHDRLDSRPVSRLPGLLCWFHFFNNSFHCFLEVLDSWPVSLLPRLLCWLPFNNSFHFFLEVLCFMIKVTYFIPAI